MLSSLCWFQSCFRSFDIVSDSPSFGSLLLKLIFLTLSSKNSSCTLTLAAGLLNPARVGSSGLQKASGLIDRKTTPFKLNGARVEKADGFDPETSLECSAELFSFWLS